MTIDERVGRLVQEKTNELLDLFQSSEDQTKDVVDRLDRLIHALPLIQDIKTEVADIQKKISNPPKDDEDDKQDDNQPDSTEDQTDPEVIKFLEDLTNSLLDLRQLSDNLLLDNPKYPALPGWGKGNFKNQSDKNFVRLFWYLWKKLKDLRDHVDDAISKNLSRNQIDYILETTRTVKNVVDLMSDELVRRTDSLSSALEECCSNTTEALQSMQQTMNHIRRKVDELSPEADANKDLALQSRCRAILSEVQTLRGLL